MQKDPLWCIVLFNLPNTMHLFNLCSHRMVVLDPTLTKMLVNKNEDLELLAWDQLFERLALIILSLSVPRIKSTREYSRVFRE